MKVEAHQTASDEILYNAKLHPEQYSDTFSSAQLKQLHTSILYVCQTAVDLLADSSKFPEEWLFKHRWGKGKKDSVSTLPNGAKITFLTVGGRTSCVVPSVQKKTGAVAGDVGDEPSIGKKTSDKSNRTKKRKVEPKVEEAEPESDHETTKKRKAVKGPKPTATKTLRTSSKVKEEAVEAPSEGRRRSGRASNPKD
jgi:formamidopyrimidine-DNA glycosylase